MPVDVLTPELARAEPDRAADPARSAAAIVVRLEAAARALGARPVSCAGAVGELLLRTLAGVSPALLPAGTLVPSRLPIELSFSQRAPQQLRIDFEPLLGATPGEREAAAREAFLADCGHRLPAAVLEHVGWAGPRTRRFGAYLGVITGAEGVDEIKLYRELGGDDDAVPPSLLVHLTAARAHVPDATPHLVSIAWRAASPAARLYLRSPAGLRLSAIADLASTLGLAERAHALADAALALGAPVRLDPTAAVLGLRLHDDAWQLKLDLLPGALPDDAATRRRRIALVLHEMPGAAQAFARWCAAVGAGDLAIVGLSIGAHTGVALTAYLHPALDRRCEP
jgi:hypothetical protein